MKPDDTLRSRTHLALALEQRVDGLRAAERLLSTQREMLEDLYEDLVLGRSLLGPHQPMLVELVEEPEPGKHCRAGCRTKNHESYAACLTAAHVQIGNLK